MFKKNEMKIGITYELEKDDFETVLRRANVKRNDFICDAGTVIEIEDESMFLYCYEGNNENLLSDNEYKDMGFYLIQIVDFEVIKILKDAKLRVIEDFTRILQKKILYKSLYEYYIPDGFICFMKNQKIKLS